MSTSPWMGLLLDPLDTLFFRDGRPFDAANRVLSSKPTPQTLAGALRRMLLARSGFDFHNLKLSSHIPLDQQFLDANADPGIVQARIRGPFLALASSSADAPQSVEPLLPLPAVLKRAKNKSQASWSWAMPRCPKSVAGWKDLDDLSPLDAAHDPDTKAEKELITLTGLRQFLSGREPDDDQLVTAASVVATDHRVGIAVNSETFTADDGQIYSIGLEVLKNSANDIRLRNNRRVCWYAEIQLGADSQIDVSALLNGSPVPFGGEGRSVVVNVPSRTVDWPIPDPDRKTSLWYLATPTFLPRSTASKRPLPKLSKLVAAASHEGLAVSGWDVARKGPRATRFAIPPGAVYYVDGTCDESCFLDGGLEDATNLRREGWGFALQGLWNGAQE